MKFILSDGFPDIGCIFKVHESLTRTRALLFAFDVYNKSYNSAKDNYKCE